MATLKMGSTTVLTDTTLANAVQDNVTRLGTVTAGNISNSAIVYPAGHVIQMKYKRHQVGGHHYLSSGSWGSHGDEASFKFTFTPKSATSTIMLDYFQPVTHTSSGGGYGYMAFTKDGSRVGWGIGSDSTVENYGHFYTGFSTYAGMYHSAFGRLVYTNSSTSAFEIGLDVKWAAGNWYYAHANGFCALHATEFEGNCSA